MTSPSEIASPWRAISDETEAPTLPPERRLVLLRVRHDPPYTEQPDVYAVGYLRRYSDGQPYYVIPGYPVSFRVVAWADVLPTGLPLWNTKAGER